MNSISVKIQRDREKKDIRICKIVKIDHI
jgi:hypothetical protein